MGGIDPKVAQVLGLAPSAASDAHAVVMACLNKCAAPLRAILNRSTHRTGLASLTVSENGKTAKVRLSPASTKAEELGAQIASFITHSPGCLAVFLDEGALMLVGLPEGPPHKSLDAAPTSQVSPTTVALLGPRGIFGIDDALIIGALPVLATLFVAILPFLISVGGSIVSFVGGVIAPKPAPGPPPVPENVLDRAGDAIGIGPQGQHDSSKDTKVVIIVLVLAVGLVWTVRRKKAG